MENKRSSKIKVALPSVLLLALICLLAGLSFIPATRGTGAASVRSAAVDDSAVRVLAVCREYMEKHDFSGKTRGSVKARVWGVPYTQSVNGSRRVSGEGFEEIFESVSSLVKAGVRKSGDGKVYAVSRGEYKKKAFEYGEGSVYDLDGYTCKYGAPPTGLVKYDLTDAIIGAVCVDENTYVYTLDAERATKRSRNEIATTLGAKVLEYEFLEITLITDGVRAISVNVKEKFKIDKFGGTECSATYKEIFEY